MVSIHSINQVVFISFLSSYLFLTLIVINKEFIIESLLNKV